MIGTPQGPGTAPPRQFGRTQSPRRLSGAPGTALATLPTTGPRRNLTFDTTGRSHLPFQRSPATEQEAREVNPLADRLFEEARMEDAEKKALEKELLRGVKDELRRLAARLDAEDWMYAKKPALPFKM